MLKFLLDKRISILHYILEEVNPPSNPIIVLMILFVSILLLMQLAYHCFWFVFMLGPHAANYLLQPGFAWTKQDAASRQ